MFIDLKFAEAALREAAAAAAGEGRESRGKDLTSHSPYVCRIPQELETKDHQTFCCKLDFTSLPGMSSDSNALQGGGDAAGSSTELLSAILNDIGASEFLQNFIDDDQDDDCIASYKIPNKLCKSYGLPQHLAASFVEKCRLSAGAQRAAAASTSDFPSTSATTSSTASTPGPAPASAASPVDAASLLRKLNPPP